MKKITNFLTLLLLAICSIGASAETATLTYDNIQVYKNGALVTPSASYSSYNHQVRSTTEPLITITIGTGDVVYNASKFCFGNNNKTYTLAIDGNYVITSFEINYTTGSGVKFTSNGVTSDDDGQLSVTGLSTASTTFYATWNSNGSSGSWQNYSVESIVVNYEVPGTEYNYTYTQLDMVSGSTLGTGSGTASGTSQGYSFTAPSVDGYAFFAAYDGNTQTVLDLSGAITSTNLTLLYSPVLQDLANSNSSNAYTLATPRGFIYAASADTTAVSKGGSNAIDTNNPLHQWTFVELNGNKYLYNIGAKKFASFTNRYSQNPVSLVTSMPAYVQSEASTITSTYPDYPFVLKFTDSHGYTKYLNNTNGGSWGSLVIDDWSKHDEGNVYQANLVSGVTVTPEAYSATFTYANSDLTSVYIDGTKVATNTAVVLTSAAIVSDSTTVNSIATYNGFSTLAEALSDENFNGTISLAIRKYIFVYANSNQGSVYVNGVAVATGTEVVISSEITVSNSMYGNGIVSYNGYPTLAEALADENFNGTITLTLSEERSDITIYLMRGGTAIKTVTLNDVPSGTGFSIGDVVGTPAFVTGFNPATITGTAEDQTIYATYTSTLPMNLAADPTSSNASSYVMTLHSKYAHGNDATSSNVSTVNLSDNTYLWSFGGNEWDGITVYNKGNGYLNVGYRTDNSVATFSETPTTFAISPNNNATNGFELKIPNKFAYVSERSGKVSTLLNASASGNSGNTLVVYSKEDVLDAQIDALRDNYLGGSDVVGTLPSEDIATYTSEINILANNPSVEGYQELKTRLDAALIPLESGKYYIIRNAYPYFYSIQNENKVWYYNGSTVRWESEGTDPAYEVFQVVEKSNGDQVFYNPMGGVYLRSVYGAVTTDISAANAVSLSALGDGQQNIFIAGASSPIHTNDYNYGNGVEGSLTGWAGTANSPSAWYIVPQNIDEITLIAPEGVADGEDVIQGFANETDAQLPLNIIVYTISDETGVGAHIETVEGSQIAAGEGYIISGVKGATVPLLPVAEAVDVPAGNLLEAGTGATVNSGYILAYKKGDTEAKFWAIGGSGLTIPANRSYLPAGTPTRGLEFLLGNGYIDDVTGINSVNDGATTTDAIYDLQGRRVNNATKGVYIINGKKVIKK